MNKAILKQIIDQLNLSTKVLELLEDKNSEASQYLSSLVLNFCLKNLDLEKRKKFAEMLKNKTDSGIIWDYLKNNQLKNTIIKNLLK
jgi:hypothetical protein